MNDDAFRRRVAEAWDVDARAPVGRFDHYDPELQERLLRFVRRLVPECCHDTATVWEPCGDDIAPPPNREDGER